MKKRCFFTILIILVISLFIIIDKVIYLFNNNLTYLEQFKMIPENERLTYKEVIYKNNKYLLVGFKGDNPTYPDNVILLEKDSKYYILERIINCDISEETAYFKDGSFYIHCIGRKANIIKYELNNTKVKKSYIELNYKEVPNISQLHLFVNNVDDQYIYLFSYVKNNDSIPEGHRVKCSFEDKKCMYY